ncbi:GtrA family protein [Yersinia enterocolitica]|nr:GtrA family protein [Yersinia enterocolitica]
MRYCYVGLINTLVTFLFIYLFIWLGISVYWSNFFSYCIGVFFSYLLNSAFTFNKVIGVKTFIKFFINVMFSYLLNVITIFIVLFFLPDYIFLSQLAGMVLYTISGFIFNKFWVMK